MLSNDYIAPVVARLTYNGAYALRRTVEKPHPDIPRLLNGGERLYTGNGKWTTIAAIGVENHLRSLGLTEEFDAQPVWRPGRYEHPWMVDVVTDLGMEVAHYVRDHWRDLCAEFRNLSGKGR